MSTLEVGEEFISLSHMERKVTWTVHAYVALRGYAFRMSTGDHTHVAPVGTRCW